MVPPVWMRAIVAMLPLLCLLIRTSSAVNTYVEIPERVELNGTRYVISAFSPRQFIKSADFDLNSTECIEYSFELLQPRVKLSSFTCQLSEGGFCTLDKFKYPEDRAGCTYLRPWTHKIDSWSFYFVLERRARKYGKWYQERLRQGKVKRQASSKRDTSTEPVAVFWLTGVVPCSEACGSAQQKKLGSYADGTFHRGRASRLN